MNKRDKFILKLTKLNMKIDKSSYYIAKKKAKIQLKGIREMLIKRYGFRAKSK